MLDDVAENGAGFEEEVEHHDRRVATGLGVELGKPPRPAFGRPARGVGDHGRDIGGAALEPAELFAFALRTGERLVQRASDGARPGACEAAPFNVGDADAQLDVQPPQPHHRRLAIEARPETFGQLTRQNLPGDVLDKRAHLLLPAGDKAAGRELADVEGHDGWNIAIKPTVTVSTKKPKSLAAMKYPVPRFKVIVTAAVLGPDATTAGGLIVICCAAGPPEPA